MYILIIFGKSISGVYVGCTWYFWVMAKSYWDYLVHFISKLAYKSIDFSIALSRVPSERWNSLTSRKLDCSTAHSAQVSRRIPEEAVEQSSRKLLISQVKFHISTWIAHAHKPREIPLFGFHLFPIFFLLCLAFITKSKGTDNSVYCYVCVRHPTN